MLYPLSYGGATGRQLTACQPVAPVVTDLRGPSRRALTDSSGRAREPVVGSSGGARRPLVLVQSSKYVSAFSSPLLAFSCFSRVVGHLVVC